MSVIPNIVKAAGCPSRSESGTAQLQSLLTVIGMAVVVARRSKRHKDTGSEASSTSCARPNDDSTNTVESTNTLSETIERIREVICCRPTTSLLSPAVTHGDVYARSLKWKAIACLFNFKKLDICQQDQLRLLKALMIAAPSTASASTNWQGVSPRDSEGNHALFGQIQEVVIQRTRLPNEEFFHKLMFGLGSFLRFCSDIISVYGGSPASMWMPSTSAISSSLHAGNQNHLMNQLGHDEATWTKILEVKATLLATTTQAIIALAKDHEGSMDFIYQRIGTLCILLTTHIHEYVNEANVRLRASRIRAIECPNIADYFDRNKVQELIARKSSCPEDWVIALIEDAMAHVDAHVHPLIHNAFLATISGLDGIP